MSNPAPPEIDLRALDLFERLAAYPGNARFRTRLLKREKPETLARLAQIEAGHAARRAMPTEMPEAGAPHYFTPTKRIGPFRLTTRIGQGGMGDVWRGERDDGLFDQTVAIKLIHAHLGTVAKAAFEKERRILARLDHPDIVRLTDGGVTGDGIQYLIMDYVDGIPFDEATETLPLDNKVRLFQQAARVVQFAHGRLIAHADIKPSNILVDTTGRVRLLDFGISSLLNGDGSYATTTDHGAMTRAFASPQRQAGAPPSIADDVFALGKLLELIVPEHCDRDLRAIVSKATAEDETSRYATVAALGDELDLWRAQLPVSARGNTLPYRIGKFVRRNRVAVAATALALASLVGTTLYAMNAAVRAEKARIEAAARFEDARGTARYLLFTLMGRLEAKPNSLVLRGEVARVAQHYLERLAGAVNATADVKLEAARGLIRLAETQGVPGYPNLAMPAAAMTSLDRAIALVGHQPNGEAASLAVTALNYRARLNSLVNQNTDLAKQDVRRAEALMAANASIPPHLKAQTLAEHAIIQGENNQYDEVIKTTTHALTLLPSTVTLDILLERAKLMDLLGEATFYARSPTASVKPYENAVAMLVAGQRQFPESRRVKRALAYARWALASTILSLNRNAEALKLEEQNAADLQKMVAFDDDDLEARRLLQMVELDHGSALADVGRLDDGIAVLNRNIQDRRDWLKRMPNELRRLRDLAIGVKALGDIQTRHGRTQDGCKSYDEFHRLANEMAQRGNINQMDMAYTFDDLAKMEARYCRSVKRKHSST
jgi:eukaryotic-like serine/threonine-protein kinase